MSHNRNYYAGGIFGGVCLPVFMIGG